MRFFSGTRSGSNKKGKAGDMYLKKLRGITEPELTPDEKYKKNLETKIDSLMLKGTNKKASFSLPGTEMPEKKMSKHYRAVLEKLAEKKAQKERDRQRRKEREKYFAEQAVKRAQELVKKAEEAKKQQGAYWFGMSPDEKK